MNGPLSSLHVRLTVALVLLSLGIFLGMGMLLYKGFEADAVEADRVLLAQSAAWVEAIAREEGALDGDPDALAQRFASLQRLHPALRVEVALPSPPEAPQTAPAWLRQDPVARAPVAAVDGDGEAVEAVHLQVERGAGQPPMHVWLALPVAAREARLHAYRDRLAWVGAAGAALMLLLCRRAVRHGLRHLRELVREAREAEPGVRLSMTHVDDELVDLVQAFNAALDDQETALRKMEGFSADVAHELRSPLAVLINGAQLTLAEDRSVAELREALASNLEDLGRLNALVNDMLFLARADQGERAQSLERVDLAQLADTTIEYCSALFDDADVSVQRQGEASAVCNAALIRRALVNLLSNAARHTPAGGRVVLHLEALPGKVMAWVDNAGEPLSPEVSARIFDRFYRASAARAPHDGYGLGLTIVQAVAQMHGGRVFARAREGGNVIGLEIPGALASTQRRLREREHVRPT